MFLFGISSWGDLRCPLRAFTEQCVAMLSSVLRSKRAVQVNILIMRAFVKMREMLQSVERSENPIRRKAILSTVQRIYAAG